VKAPPTFRRGAPIPIEARRSAGDSGVASVVLRYRRVDQAETYREAEMRLSGDTFAAEIPADYTDSPFGVLYLFEVRGGKGSTGLYPGFGPDLCGQPYFVSELEGRR
jgi:hypothetical protein